MGKIFFYGCALVFLIGIMKSNGINRLIWFLIGIMFFQRRIPLITIPTEVPFHRFLVYALLLPELIYPKQLYRKLRNFPLLIPLGIIFAGLILVGLYDERINLFLKIYRPIDFFIQTFFIIFLAFININKENDWNKFVKFIMASAFIMCLYGFYNYVTKTNPYDNLISNTFNTFSSFDFYKEIFDQRFRINSFVDHPIYYGYLVGVYFLFSLNGLLNSNKNKLLFAGITIMTFLNLILTNSRTPLISFAIGVTIFIILITNFRKKMLIAILTIIILLTIKMIPLINNKIESTINLFEPNDPQISGSSLGMRKTQLQAAMNLYSEQPIFGHGLYYIEETLGYSSDDSKNNSPSDLQGYESYLYILLIEQGLVGIIANAIFFLAIFKVLIRGIRFSRVHASLGIAITCMFLVFSIGTGTLGSWIVTMSFLGILIKWKQIAASNSSIIQIKPAKPAKQVLSYQ